MKEEKKVGKWGKVKVELKAVAKVELKAVWKVLTMVVLMVDAMVVLMAGKLVDEKVLALDILLVVGKVDLSVSVEAVKSAD